VGKVLAAQVWRPDFGSPDSSLLVGGYTSGSQGSLTCWPSWNSKLQAQWGTLSPQTRVENDRGHSVQSLSLTHVIPVLGRLRQEVISSVRAYIEVHSQLKVSLGYIMCPFMEETNKKKKNNSRTRLNLTSLPPHTPYCIFLWKFPVYIYFLSQRGFYMTNAPILLPSLKFFQQC
jgi:hypothetical protein